LFRKYSDKLCRMKFGLIVPLLSVALLAQPSGKPIRNEIRVLRWQAAKMRDGVTLYGDVYLPKLPGRYPAIIVRTPYGVQRDGAHASLIRFAQMGYAAVMQDVRGRYESEGKWEPFRHEGRDGYDTIAWAAAQPWCNGKVAMQGGSYLGHVQWAAASQKPAALVTMFPGVASTNLYANWITQGGAFRLSFNYGWGVVRMPKRIMQPQYFHTEAFSPEELRYANILPHLPLETGDLKSAGNVVQHYRDWLKHESYDAYWKEISDEESFEAVKVPVHTIGGWFDIFLAGTINGYTGMRARGASAQARAESKMIIGPWGHGPSMKIGDIEFGAPGYVDQTERELRWFDHYMKGMDNGIDKEKPVRIYYMGANVWKDHDDWPIPGARVTPLHLSSSGKANSLAGDGALSFAQPSGAASDSYRYDPMQPVPTLGGNNCCGTPTIAGPQDQRPLEHRADVLVYSSEPLEKPLAIAGPVKMRLFASTDGPDTDWMVKLVDVSPNGYAMNVAEGMLRARFREGLDRPKLLEPGKVYEFTVDMVGTANVFQSGHRIRVDVTSSNFPQFDRNPNTGEALGASDRVRAAQQLIFHDVARPSAILLPIVDLP
jgi:uncharacterized protein